jgi:hypothetical protein
MKFLFILSVLFLSSCASQQSVPGMSSLDNWYKDDVVNYLKMMAKEKYGCKRVLITDTKIIEESELNKTELWTVEQCGILENYQVQKILKSTNTINQVSTNTSSTTYSTTTYSSVATRPQLRIKSVGIAK